MKKIILLLMTELIFNTAVFAMESKPNNPPGALISDSAECCAVASVVAVPYDEDCQDEDIWEFVPVEVFGVISEFVPNFLRLRLVDKRCNWGVMTCNKRSLYVLRDQQKLLRQGGIEGFKQLVASRLFRNRPVVVTTWRGFNGGRTPPLFTEFKNVVSLKLENTQITQKEIGLAILPCSESLVVLSFQWVRITASQIANILPLLPKITALKLLLCSGITNANVDELRAAFPQVKIVFVEREVREMGGRH